MNAATRSRIELLASYCGPGYVVIVLLGFWAVAGFVPPPSPSTDIQLIAGVFRSDYTRIRIGMLLVMWSAVIFLPFAALISRLLARIEGSFGVLSGTALLGGAGNMVLTFYPAIWWLAAAYRPDRPPELVYAFNDWAWLQFIGGVSIYDALPLSVAVAAFCDASAKPVFPRWAGYFNLLVVALIVPDQLLFFFHGGPFAWSGLFGFWIPLVAFSSWFFVNFAFLRNAILRERC